VPPDDLAQRLADARASTGRFLAALPAAGLTDEMLRQPSLLPDWSRGHVLSHLARNADALERTLDGARRGTPAQMYPGGQAGRDAEIEAGAARAAGELVADVVAAAGRLDRAWTAMSGPAWDAPALTRVGTVPAWRTIGARWREVEIHWMDLDIGYGPADWPPGFVAAHLPELVRPDRLAPRLPAGVSVDIDATDSGQRWSVGAGAHRVVVAGPSWALVCWLAGRPAAVRAELGEPPSLTAWA
jgi:maleylpyruvate isomerase